MRVVSIDVGIRNLAICMINTSTRCIDFWQVINLLKDDDAETNHRHQQCSQTNKNGTPCKFKARYLVAAGGTVCKKHCSESSDGQQQQPKEILVKKKAKVKALDIQKLCTLVCQRLLENPILFEAEYVLIELQPKINAKMKNLSNMLYTCFVLKGIVEKVPPVQMKKVLFISAKHKLKPYDGPFIDASHLKGKYARTKYTGRKQCEHYLSTTEQLQCQLDFFKGHKKQDDLADSFLQGVWFIHIKLKNKIF